MHSVSLYSLYIVMLPLILIYVFTNENCTRCAHNNNNYWDRKRNGNLAVYYSRLQKKKIKKTFCSQINMGVEASLWNF